MSSSNFKNEFAQILIIFCFPAHVCMYDINIIMARDGEDKMTNGFDIDLILHDTILISLLADGSKDRIECGPGSDMTWKCEESKLADLSKVKN
jgi:hypothetical protein